MRHLPVLLAALVTLGQPLSAETPEPHPDAAGFFEDFTGGLDRDRWYVSDGWTNGDWQDCHWSGGAVRVQDGTLTLFHIPVPEGGGRPAQCGEVQTRARLHHGTFEARIRTPRAPGLNASVFTYIGPVHGAPHDEIDIEILTRDPGEMTANTYVAGKPHNGGAAPATPPFDEAFHTVAFRWEPDRITWYLDGQKVHRTAPGSLLPTHPQKLYMSFWSTETLTDWLGKQVPREGPLGYEIDWVAYTPLGQACLFEESVTCVE
ncbi:family 16 glycosylhydrolase [Paracoccus niistensis]|uniref:Family 16 glycosylhydrolase n=1 Tax=Paracoccus niistensis TaxID=632935 RepID=A0ABV6I706_9RHOB